MQHHSGARQWRHPCETCGNPDVGYRRMHSKISKNNHKYFISENRVGPEVTADELLDMVNRADGSVIVCNNCGVIREVDG